MKELIKRFSDLVKGTSAEASSGINIVNTVLIQESCA